VRCKNLPPYEPPDPHCEHGYDVQEAICPVCKTGEHAHPPKPPCGCCVFDEKYKSWVFDCECRNYDDNARAAGWCAEQNVTAPLQAEIERLTSEIEGHKNSAMGLNITISLQAKEIERLTALLAHERCVYQNGAEKPSEDIASPYGPDGSPIEGAVLRREWHTQKAQIERLTAELDRRYNFIGRYADHDQKCIDHPGDKCICGYHERLMALRAAVEPSKDRK
jgi:uncharacterized small protein (DUF1192 family)